MISSNGLHEGIKTGSEKIIKKLLPFIFVLLYICYRFDVLVVPDLFGT
jgi:hypothetical protein